MLPLIVPMNVVFRQHIQKAKKLAMGIDGHPFPEMNMVEFQLAKGKTKVLTSAKAKEDGLVDPKV